MPLNSLHVYAAARVARIDLVEIDRQLTNEHELDDQWMLLVKFALISVANLTDLQVTVRHMYKKHPEVAAEFKKWNEQFKFAKYVRNIFVGHLDDTLISKAIEWKPELLSLISRDDDRDNFLLNLFILETALNTYVDAKERHLVFDGDTDLIFPPNWNRFLVFLTAIVRGGIAFLETLIRAVRADIPPVPEDAELMMLYRSAGRTVFKRITKTGPS
jgi:hypothetical protein